MSHPVLGHLTDPILSSNHPAWVPLAITTESFIELVCLLSILFIPFFLKMAGWAISSSGPVATSCQARLDFILARLVLPRSLFWFRTTPLVPGSCSQKLVHLLTNVLTRPDWPVRLHECCVFLSRLWDSFLSLSRPSHHPPPPFPQW